MPNVRAWWHGVSLHYNTHLELVRLRSTNGMITTQPSNAGTCLPTTPGGVQPAGLTQRQHRTSRPQGLRAGLAGLALAAFAFLMAAAPAWAATVTYNFSDGTLQGWHNRVWDLSANAGAGGWIDLDPNVQTMPGTVNGGAIQPPSADDNLFGVRSGSTQVDPVGGQNDNHLNTLWLRSPKFILDGSGNLTAQLARGMANTTAPANDAAVPYAATTGGGWKGVALRRTSDGAFVLAKPRTTTGDAMVTVTFTAAELAPYSGISCSLELINSDRGGWGWLSMDNVSIPGYLAQAKMTLAGSTLFLGTTTNAVLTIPTNFNATAAITVYVTNSNPTALSINGSTAPVVEVVFPAGTATSQNLTLVGTVLGRTVLTAACPGLDMSTGTIAVILPVPASGLIGSWLTGSEDLLDKSGFTPAGTHDGVLSAGLTPVFSLDVPPGVTSGSSLDLAASGGAVLITNTVITDPGYAPTFDEGTRQQISVAFWAKGTPGNWNPFVSKYGEGATGWQVRKRGGDPIGVFTLRGTRGEDDPYTGSTLIDDGAWHHFAVTWDGVTGVRKLYVDGKVNNWVPNDFGFMGLANVNYLTLGGRCGAGSASPGNLFFGQLFDVQIYGKALDGGAVQSIFTRNTSAIVAYADNPVVDLGKTGVVSVAIPATANATTAVTVFVTNATPAIASLAGAVGNVRTLTFAVGGAPSQTLVLTGLGNGVAKLDCASAVLTPVSLEVKVCGPSLIGHWFNGTESYTNSSTFTPEGTHDGTEVGAYGTLTFTSDTPPSKPGKAAQFGGGVGLLINNSSMMDPSYAPTFDDVAARQFSVAFWAKGVPGTWNPFISKRGDENIGWQLRRSSGAAEAFTIRGTGSANADGVGSIALEGTQWHHYAGVWDGHTGTRKCYVDGILDTNINLTGDFGPLMMAPNHHLILGAREQGQISATPGVDAWFNGLLYDVRMYNYPLSLTEVKALSFVAAIKVAATSRSLQAPQTMGVEIILPEGATTGRAITVQVRNDTPTLASLVGAVGNIVTLTYPVGGSVTQLVTVAGIADGRAQLTASGGGFVAGTGNFNVWAAPGSKLIGHWFTGLPSFADTSGFRPAGTHDAVPVASATGDPSWVGFIEDAPPGYTGQSLNLTAGNVAVMVTNTATTDLGYVETFDEQISNKFSIAFWAKGTVSTEDWNSWVSKNGESSGYQVRRIGTDNPFRPTFTIRGTGGADDPGPSTSTDMLDWHHFAATWDGNTGIRKLYMDGNVIITVTGDSAPFTVPSLSHLMIGGLDTGTFRRFFPCLLYDVRIYSYGLSATEVGVLATPPSAFALTLKPLTIPQGETVPLEVVLPAGSTATGPVTVFLTNNSPSVVKIVGSTGNVFAVTFPIGSLVQVVYLQTLGPGQIDITGGAAGVGSGGLTTVNMVVTPALIGHWLAGATDLADKSGFTPAGTHDGLVAGANPEALAFSTDVPAGFVGQSLDLTTNGTVGITVGVVVTNSAQLDGGYLPTFDGGIANTFTIALWAKGVPGTWNGFVSKRGEDGIGWQMRRGGGDTEAFTSRGTSSGNADGVGSVVMTGGVWHHYAGVWDGITGTRKCYVDGVLDPSVNLIEDFAPMSLAPDHHVGIGTREQGSIGSYEGWFNGKLCDVRIYNYPITAAQVAELVAGNTPPTLKVQRWTGNQVRLSWPTSFPGYSIQQSAKVTGVWELSGLIVTVEGSENVAYAPATTGSQFFRLKK